MFVSWWLELGVEVFGVDVDVEVGGIEEDMRRSCVGNRENLQWWLGLSRCKNVAGRSKWLITVSYCEGQVCKEIVAVKKMRKQLSKGVFIESERIEKWRGR